MNTWKRKMSTRKIRMSTDKKYLHVMRWKWGNKINKINKRKRKQVVPSIQCNESSKESLPSDSTELNFTAEQYSYYDDFNLNLKLKPLKHPFTKKAQLSVLETSFEGQICKSESLLLQNDCISIDKNMSLNQLADKPNNRCLALTTVLQSHNQTICENNSSSAPDDESRTDEDSDFCNERSVKSHPNRRFIVEKTNSQVFNGSFGKAKTYISPQTKSTSVDEKSSKVSAMWLDILNTPDLWKTETLVASHSGRESTDEVSNHENTVDFEEMIDNFNELKNGKSSNRVNEDKFEEELADLDFKQLPFEFYIPPAKLEVLYSKLTPDMSQQECLSRLCTEMKWLQPTYTVVRKNKANVLFSCNLKSKSFRPKRAGKSMDLNKELAAFECLNWLGFRTK